MAVENTHFGNRRIDRLELIVARLEFPKVERKSPM
jgi:hypothetical protein